MSRRTIGLAVAALIAVSSCTGAASREPANSGAESRSTTPVESRTEGWTQDIPYLVACMEAIHPDLFHGVTQAAFDRAVDALVAALPTLSDDEVLVGIMRLVAMISSDGRDGHMGVWPPDNPEAVHRFPIRVWEFPDGLYVTDALTPNEDLVGSLIVAVDGLPVQEMFERLDPVVPRDNASNLRAARSVFLTSAEVLSGLGLAQDPQTLQLEVVDSNGERRTATVRAVDADVYADWIGGWELLLPARPDLMFLRHPEENYSITYLPSSRALYVQYNVVQPSSFEVAQQLEAAMQGRRVDRIVLDLRNNGGGEANGYHDLFRFLRSPEIDRPGRLYVLIGRLTFSAGASLAVLLQQEARHVVFVGEDTGGAPNFWANPVEVTLPWSNVRALIARRYFPIGGANDERSSVEPDIEVPFTSTDYFAGSDPSLDAALADG